MFILNLLEPSTALRLLHHHIHASEALLKRISVLPRLVLIKLDQLLYELLLYEY